MLLWGMAPFHGVQQNVEKSPYSGRLDYLDDTVTWLTRLSRIDHEFAGHMLKLKMIMTCLG